MLTLSLSNPRTILFLGCHSDDVEIGCGGTVRRLVREYPDAKFHWVVFSANEERRKEAEASAQDFLAGARESHVEVANFRDGYFPYDGTQVKDYFDAIR